MLTPTFHPAAAAATSAMDLLFDDQPTSTKRTRRAEHEGRQVWIKRYDTERPSFGSRAHRILTKLVPIPFWRPSLPLRPGEMVARELRKYAAFESAGIAVPEIVGARRATIVIADVGPSLAHILKRLKAAGAVRDHDVLLVRMARALGEVHRAGLCHGRPHPRDMGLLGDRIAFFDFEEEPETVMPLADAQARDVWLLFLHITSLAIEAETPARALDSYARMAPGETQTRLAALVGSMWWIIPLGRAISRIHFGGDLRRLLGATVFLAAATVIPGAPYGAGVNDNMPTEQMRALVARDADEGDDEGAARGE